MCNDSCISFGRKNITREEINGKRVIEIGSLDINGTLRPYIMSQGPLSYIGVDIEKGPGVDIVCNADDIIDMFGKESFDVVISTELLEHVKDWRKVISNIKNICKQGGIVLATTRSIGFAYHSYPYDFWRYELEDISNIFSDYNILSLEKDPHAPGIFIKAKKPNNFIEKNLANYKLYNIIYDSRIETIEYNTKTQNIIDEFHLLYYNSRDQTWMNTYWLGIPIQKLPLDLWIYQEIIFETKPDIIIETGTADGGSASFLASICDLIGKGRVITVDIVSKPRPWHSRISYVLGSSTSDNIFNTVSKYIKPNDKVMVILDSDHSKGHVAKEIDLYNKFVTIGSYLIIEDSNINGHPVLPNFGPGPMEALEEFLKGNKSFIWDTTKEKFFLTQNPKGYLRRIS